MHADKRRYRENRHLYLIPEKVQIQVTILTFEVVIGQTGKSNNRVSHFLAIGRARWLKNTVLTALHFFLSAFICVYLRFLPLLSSEVLSLFSPVKYG